MEQIELETFHFTLQDSRSIAGRDLVNTSTPKLISIYQRVVDQCRNSGYYNLRAFELKKANLNHFLPCAIFPPIHPLKRIFWNSPKILATEWNVSLKFKLLISLNLKFSLEITHTSVNQLSSLLQLVIPFSFHFYY